MILFQKAGAPDCRYMHFQGNGNLNINYIINCFEDFVEKNFTSQKAYELENTRLQGTLLALDKLINVKDPKMHQNLGP